MSEKEKETVDEEEDEESVGCGLAFVAIAAGFCYLTWFQSDLLDSLFDADTSGRGASKVKGILFLVYNRVTGTLAGGLALLSIYGIIKKLTKRKELPKSKT